MASVPSNPVDVPPFQLQRLISDVGGQFEILCAQAFGSEIYVGCSNGELIRFALQADDPNKRESYTILSRQTLPGDKPVDEIVIIPSLSRALVLSDHQIYFYTVPSLDPFPIKPIRHVVTFAVDDQHLKRPPSSSPQALRLPVEPVDFCIVKRAGLAMYSLKDRLVYLKEMPLPQGVTLARRIGRSLCIADQATYSLVDLEGASLLSILPLSQANEPASFVVNPSITVIGPNEFLILSWTGSGTLGVFISAEGDPVRGTLQWPSHPKAICLDYPYITSLLPNNTIEIHSVETQTIVQVIGAPPPTSPKAALPVRKSNRSSSTARNNDVDSSEQVNLVASIGGYLVPSTQRLDKLRTVPVKLIRT